MYHRLTSLHQSLCPLTFNLLLTFPQLLRSHLLSRLVTALTFTWRGSSALLTGGCQAPLVNINLFSLACHSRESSPLLLLSFFHSVRDSRDSLLSQVIKQSLQTRSVVLLLILRTHPARFKEHGPVQKSNLMRDFDSSCYM